MIALTLPLPPTINTYHGFHGKRRYIKADGLAFRKEVAVIVKQAGFTKLEGRLAVLVEIYPADRRKQDLDNRAKSLQDALTVAGAWLDDSQIDDLHLVRREVIKGGQVKVVITVLADKEVA